MINPLEDWEVKNRIFKMDILMINCVQRFVVFFFNFQYSMFHNQSTNFILINFWHSSTMMKHTHLYVHKTSHKTDILCQFHLRNDNLSANNSTFQGPIDIKHVFKMFHCHVWFVLKRCLVLDRYNLFLYW